MQHHKVIKNVEQIGKICQNESKITDSITDVLKKFGVKSVLSPFNIIKRSGALVSTIMYSLLLLPFITQGTVWEFFTRNLNKEGEGKKDSFYELKNNSKINWRTLLYGIVRRFIFLTTSKNESNIDCIKALIIDDTTIAKTGNHIEGSGYVYDHVIGRFILGFKILVLGYWDGVSFIPIDFSIHREKRDTEIKKAQNRIEKKKKQIKKWQENTRSVASRIKKISEEIKDLQLIVKNNPTNTHKKQLNSKLQTKEKQQNRFSLVQEKINEEKQKLHFLENAYYDLKKQRGKYGLKKEDYSKQFKKSRPQNTAGYKRIKEADTSKIDSMISMIKRALKRRIKFGYILTDSWFFCGKLLKYISSLNNSIHLVSMAKMGNAKYKILPENKYLSAKQIIEKNKRKLHTNRRYKAKYIKVQATYQDIRVVLFFVNIGKGENWRLLVSTDINISFNKLMEVYKIRWTIEVFFKEAKQYLLFGKSQSQDFDAQIADTTLSLIRYILLSYYERIHYGISIGGLFKKLSQAAVEENLVADLSSIFMELLIEFAQLAGIDFMTVYEELIRKPHTKKLVNKLRILNYLDAA